MGLSEGSDFRLIPGSDAKCCHQGDSQTFHERVRIRSSDNKEHKWQRDERMDKQTTYDSQHVKRKLFQGT